MDLTNIIPAEWAVALQPFIEQYNLATPERLAAFLSQVSVESNNFTATEENLNYSAHGLLATFPTHFTADEANDYAHNPERIANRVYANRMGNGSEDSGDGWHYRGRGLIQLTGLTNYNAFSNGVSKTTEECVEYLSTKEGAAESACWYWARNNLNQFADIGDTLALTKRINGGTNGLTERAQAYDKYKAQLC